MVLGCFKYNVFFDLEMDWFRAVARGLYLFYGGFYVRYMGKGGYKGT